MKILIRLFGGRGGYILPIGVIISYLPALLLVHAKLMWVVVFVSGSREK